ASYSGRSWGRLDIDTNFGFRKSFLPQGNRRYSPFRQPTAQQVMIDKISAGPITLILIGAHTNFAIFLLNNPRLKKNVKHIYIMGGGVRSKNPTGCCPKNATTSSCQPRQCGDRGNLFTDYTSNPYAEFNIFGDPFAAYQVIHSGIPVTLVPLDATNTIPISQNFFEVLEQNQHTYEAQYCFKSLKMARDTWFDDQFYTSYFMWDSFTAGVAASIMRKPHNHAGENEFAEMEYMNITVVTSNEPYGIFDGSNPLFNGLKTPKFKLKKDGVHSGHVQTGLQDPFCIVKNGKGKCKDGYTMEVTGPEAVRVLVATRAKPSQDNRSSLSRAFFKSFLDAILVSPTGWANAATIDVIYDLLHMMGRDDIPVGLGDVFAMNQTDPLLVGVGDCKYSKAIPHGGGGLLDSDTLYGLARDLPRSPRRYTAENSAKFGAPRDTDHPELRQPLALEIWDPLIKSLDPGSKITILTNGPLTTLAKIILSRKNISCVIQEVVIVGGHINYNNKEKGNVLNVPSNEYAELNMFLDPLAAKTVLESELKVTLIPLGIQRKVCDTPTILARLFQKRRTPEALFATRLLRTMQRLQRTHYRYKHMDTFVGEILGAVILADDLKSTFEIKHIKVSSTGDESEDGQVIIDNIRGKPVKILQHIDPMAYYDLFANQLGDKQQSAVVGSFDEQRRIWSTPNNI
ncbi:unnamed protein product, partial [Ilex paraguariensis]